MALAAPHEAALIALWEKARARGITVVPFREPDLGDELTALAFAPGKATRRVCSNLPLAGRDTSGQQAALARESSLRVLSHQMRETDQVPGVQNVLAHGASVREHYLALLDHLSGRVDLVDEPNWRLPSWVSQYATELLAAQPPRWVMERYLTMHDCGKPSALVVDPDGRRHFPDHAAVSTRVYLEQVTGGGQLAPTQDELAIAALIGSDMDAHLLKADGIPAFVATGLAPGQLLAALAEVTSNAAMFGGVDSTSFKIKWKHLDKRGRAVCKTLFGDADDDGAVPPVAATKGGDNGRTVQLQDAAGVLS